MTEAEWLAATDPEPMLEFLCGKAINRKLILFCLRWCPLYAMERANGDPAYDRAMRYAEVGDNLEELRFAWGDPDAESEPSLPERPLDWALVVTDPSLKADLATRPTNEAPQMLRDIIGNPFRPVTLNPSWLTSTVLALAQQMYDSHDFSPIPILADALQDAGCDNEGILNHCRQPGEHCRGCWVIDLLLDKK